MPARRDYAEAWRDSVMTLAQVPVAGLIAGDFLYKQWVERSQTYLTHVSARFALSRPAVIPSSNVMAEVLTDDLVDVTRAFVQELVSLPGQTAQHFNVRLEAMLNDVLMQVQPDAGKDPGTYVVNELDKLNRGISRLREVAAAATTRDTQARGGGSVPPRPRDRRALSRLLADVRALARPGAGRTRRPAMPRERMLQLLQDILDAALTRFPAAIPRARRRARAGELTLRRVVQRQDAQLSLEEAQARLSSLGPAPRRKVGKTRRTRR